MRSMFPLYAAMTCAAIVCLTSCQRARSTATLLGVTITQTTPHFGFAICTPGPLHDCIATIPIRHGTLVTPAVDIAPDCIDEAHAALACPGSSNDTSVQRCYAEHGVIIDLFGVPDPSLPTYPSEMRLACEEGVASIGFIEPF